MVNEFQINKICDKLEKAEVENKRVLKKVTKVRFSVQDMEWQDYYDNIQSDLEIFLKQLVRIRWLLFRSYDVSDEYLLYYDKEIDKVNDYINKLKHDENDLLN